MLKLLASDYGYTFRMNGMNVKDIKTYTPTAFQIQTDR